MLKKEYQFQNILDIFKPLLVVTPNKKKKILLDFKEGIRD